MTGIKITPSTTPLIETIERRLKMNDIMIDIETMSTETNAAMIQLAAVYFDRDTGETGEEFCMNVSLEDCVARGFDVSDGTKAFWDRQDPAVLAGVMSDPYSVADVLAQFQVFLGTGKKSIWSHATFDFVIVNNYLKHLLLKPMFYLWARDIRTVVDLADINIKDFKNEGDAHNALDDCKFQIKYCVAGFNKLKGRLS